MDDNTDTPAARLRWARINAGYKSAEAFAPKCGIKPVTYRAYENDAIGFAKYAGRFAKALGVTTDWLLEGGPMPDGADKMLEAKRSTDIVASDLGLVMVREVDISYAMGDGAVIEDYPEMGIMPFQENFLRALRIHDVDQIFICKGDGDSMAPTILNQDMVLVDAGRKRISLSDHVWALVVAGAGMIKRLRPLPDGRIAVLSDNPLVPEQIYAGEDVYVVGKVVWIGRMM